MNPVEYRVGDVIRYETYGGTIRTVKVTARWASKDGEPQGEPGFDGDMTDSSEILDSAQPFAVWGYDSQIIEVVNAPRD